jgi:hypothetical protein
MYSATLSLTSALDGQSHAPVDLPPVETGYPLYWRLGGLQAGQDGCENSAPTGIFFYYSLVLCTSSVLDFF